MPKAPYQGTSKVPPNNNPRGINQYRECPAPNDPRIAELLMAYQRKGITDRKKISKLLHEEHGVTMSETTVTRRRRELGLKASGKTTAELSNDVKRQLVLDQMVKDKTGRIGVHTVKARILEDTGIDLTRECIRKEMQILDPEAYEARRPHHKVPSTKHMSCNSSTNRGSASTSSVGSDPPLENSDSLIIEDTEHEVEINHSRLVEFSPSRENPSVNRLRQPSAVYTELRDMVTRTEARMTALTRYLCALDPTTSLDPTTLQSLSTCMESATLLGQEITRFIST